MLPKHIHAGHVYRAKKGEYREVLSTHHRLRGREAQYRVVDEPSLGNITIPIEQFAREAIFDLTTPPGDELLLTAEEAAESIGIRSSTLARWRVNGTPKRYLDAGAALPYVRMPEGVRYHRRDVDAFRETLAAQVQV